MKEPSASPRKAERDWIETSRGQEAASFQRSAQITWWSILMGLALAELARKIAEILIGIKEPGQWILLLYALAACLVVISAWVQNTWAILIYRLPIRIVHTGLSMLTGIAIFLACLFVDQPARWWLAMVFVLVSTVMSYIYHLRVHAQLELSSKRVWVTIAIYTGFILLSLAAYLSLLRLPGTLITASWGGIALVFTILSLAHQAGNMREERRVRNIP